MEPQPKRSRIIPVFVILLLVSLLSGLVLAHAQDEPRLPDLLLPWADIYSSTSSTMTLSITFSTIDLDKWNRPTISPSSANQGYNDETDDATNTVTIHWQPRTNSSVDWTIDLFMNYTTVANRLILIGTTSVDSDGNPMNTGPFPFTISDVQNVWVRILITTRPAPHYPTAQELDTSRDPSHPTNVRLTAVEAALKDYSWKQTLNTIVNVFLGIMFILVVIVLAVRRGSG